jgi:hypothetical protein
MNRRHFLTRCAIATGLSLLRPFDHRTFAQTAGLAQTVTLTVEPDHDGTTVPPDFLGFSYESSLIPSPDFFSTANTSLLALMRRLGTQGVLRIGGNSSEFSQFQSVPMPLVTPANLPARAHPYAISPNDITRLGAFIHASGWKLIYGLNLGTGPRLTASTIIARNGRPSLRRSGHASQTPRSPDRTRPRHTGSRRLRGRTPQT